MAESTKIKILLGGVPLGCDNIGDEAILASAIAIFRRVIPNCELTVSTAQQVETERKFNCKTLPLYGFDSNLAINELRQVISNYDAFIWFGATGLSDYPEVACELLEIAQKGKLTTVLWNVGMNDTLNPMLYRVRGKRLQLCRLVKLFTGVDCAAKLERWVTNRVKKRIALALQRCQLVVLRDAESLSELRKCGDFPDATFGADSAILQSSANIDELPWNKDEHRLFNAAEKRIAICFSAQSPLRDLSRFAAWLDRLNETENVLTVMLPMNPKTDYALMNELRRQLKHPGKTIMPKFQEPEEIQSVVAQCQLVISSRLHLMILALNYLVPCIGIARGTKINSFLEKFGLPVAGTTDDVDFEVLDIQTHKYLASNEFSTPAQTARDKMLEKLSKAEKKLSAVFKKI